MMDPETRVYLKKLIEDSSDARLITGIIQRCQQVLTPDDIQVLSRCYQMLMAETIEYLNLNAEGQLIGIEDTQEQPTEENPAPVTEPKTGEVETKKTIVRKAR